jgi:hypothetical protein
MSVWPCPGIINVWYSMQIMWQCASAACTFGHQVSNPSHQLPRFDVVCELLAHDIKS